MCATFPAPRMIRQRPALVALVLIICNASAQQPVIPDDANTLDAIIVTGSRISVPGVEASSPVAAIERHEFLTSQPIAVESFLKEFPALTPSIGLASNYEPGGAATINMRGLGDNRTLVLVDGRRPVPYNLANVVDTNTIPMALLQSVEMLTGGASVVYGADAVAGVTNFLLRRDFAGVEFNLNRGESKYGDGSRQSYEITMGTLSDDGRANAVLSIGFSKADPVDQADRAWSRVFLDSTSGEPGGSIAAVPARVNIIAAGQGTRQVDLASNTLVPAYGVYNINPLNYYQTALDRWQATGLARYELNPHAQAYAQLSYTRSTVGATQAPSGFGLQLSVPLANPWLSEPMRQQICTELGIPASNCTSGRDDDNALIYVDQVIIRRLPELGKRFNDHDNKTFQATLGLRGALGEHWQYDAFWSYGESEQLQHVSNWGSAARVRQAINAISRSECLDPANGCVPLNAWGAEGSVLKEQADFINLSSFSTQRVEQTNAAFNLTGDLGRLQSPFAAMPIGVSAGVEYRRSLAGVASDAAFQSGDVLGLDGATPDSRSGFTIKEIYAETIIPLITGRAAAEQLALELGYRHSAFSNTGGFTDTYGSWKYGLNWSPLEQVKFRAMQQRATRAPNVKELFMPPRPDVASLGVDPCQAGNINEDDANTPGTLSWLCVATGVPVAAIGTVDELSAGQVRVFREGNLRLSPEKAQTTTLGVVLTPTDHISITLDWWNIEISDAISSPFAEDVVGGCYASALNPGLALNANCALIERHAQTGNLNDDGARGVILPMSNQGFIHKRGIDLGLRIQHALPGTLGQLHYALDLSKVTRDDFQATPSAASRDCLGYYSTSCWPSHGLRSTLRTSWRVHDIALTLAWRYFSALAVEPQAESNGAFFPAFRRIPAYSYFDLSVSYQAPWNARINLSINNVFNKTPPIVGGNIANMLENSGNTFPQWYDPLGRYFNLGISFHF